LQLRVQALETRHDPALVEAQRRHEEGIYEEMLQAGFDLGGSADDSDPGFPQEVWDAILAEE